MDAPKLNALRQEIDLIDGDLHKLIRRRASLVGEITALRIVPRAGTASVEATISDGSGALVAVWTGRRRIAGVVPGRRLMINGRGAPTGSRGRLLFYNPRYELL